MVEDARTRANIDPGTWDGLTWYQRHRVVALQRAKDSMANWENWVQEQALRNKSKGRH